MTDPAATVAAAARTVAKCVKNFGCAFAGGAPVEETTVLKLALVLANAKKSWDGMLFGRVHAAIATRWNSN